MKNFIYIIVVMFLFLFAVSVNGAYQYVGFNDQDYGTAIFNSNLEPITPIGKGVVNPEKAVIVADVTNNSIPDIIGYANRQIIVWENSTLTQIDSITSDCTYDIDYSPSELWVQDLDGDGFKEIIQACSEDPALYRVNIYDLSSGSITEVNSWQLDGNAWLRGEYMVGCNSDDVCLVAGADPDGGTNPIKVQGFNKTVNGSVLEVFTTVGSRVICAPKLKYMSVADFDNDGTEEFIFAYQECSTSQCITRIFYVSVSAGLVPTEDMAEVTITNTNFDTVGNACETSEMKEWITSPTVADFVPGSTLETAIGVQVTADEYEIVLFDDTGTELDEFPGGVLTHDGEIMSNVFIANVLSDTGTEDACLLAYHSVDDEIRVTCGSTASAFFDTENFAYDISGSFNLNENVNLSHLIAGTVDVVQTETDGNNLDEIVTPYGIFTIDYEGVNELLLEYEFSDTQVNESKQVLLTDVFGTDNSDALLWTDDQIWLYGDGSADNPAEVTFWQVDPCIDAIWKINTTVSVNVLVSDQDLDQVCANVTLYQNDTNEMLGGEACGDAGTVFSYQFTANETISNGILRIDGYAQEVPETIDRTDLRYSVGNNGVVFGDCTSDFTQTVGQAENYTTESQANQSAVLNNAITESVEATATRTGLGTKLLWILWMGALALFIWILSQNNNFDQKATFGVIGICEIAMLIIGTKLGFLSTGLIVTIVILALMVVGIFVSRQFMGNRAGG